MKLTLYKKCILNNSYTEVFNVKKMTEKNGQQMSVLDAYLTGLDKFEYENEFIYTEGAGSFQIELYPLQNADDIYNYNYLKVEEFDDNGNTVFKRYCFIDSILKITSDVVSVYYIEDVWSSYSGSMEIRDGVICNKLRNPAVPYYLPIQYDGNKEPKFTSFHYVEKENQRKFVFIMQLQLYDLKQQGDTNEREVRTVILVNGFDDIQDPKVYYTSNVEIINELIANQANSGYLVDRGGFDTSYQIDNITILPEEMWNWDGSALYDQYGVRAYVKDNRNIALYNLHDDNVIGGFVKKYNTSAIVQASDFKPISIGTLLHQFELTRNGADIDFSIQYKATPYDFKILLKVQNKIIDITNDFVLKIPFGTLSSEQNTQKQIERQMAIINGTFDVIEGTVKTGVQIAGAIMTGGMSLVGGTIADKATTINNRYSKVDRQLTSEKISTQTVRRNQPSAMGIVGNVRQITNGVTELVYANKPKYSSTYGTFATSEGYLNALSGGIGLMCINPSNEDYIDNLLKRIGYTVFMTVTSYDEVFNSSDKYDVVKMNTVMLYGSFPQEVNYELTEILKAGVRVFNTEDVEI